MKIVAEVSGCQRVIVVRVFVKKTQKTPNSEIELALDRAKELKQ
jgi:phage-related protein